MTPDKIYVVPSTFMEFGYIDVVCENKKGIEYLRKDALLEWLKIAEECYSHPDTANVVDMIRCEGKKWAIQDVINKIESL